MDNGDQVGLSLIPNPLLASAGEYRGKSQGLNGATDKWPRAQSTSDTLTCSLCISHLPPRMLWELWPGALERQCGVAGRAQGQLHLLPSCMVLGRWPCLSEAQFPHHTKCWHRILHTADKNATVYGMGLLKAQPTYYPNWIHLVAAD